MEEPIAIRPTSETIIYPLYSQVRPSLSLRTYCLVCGLWLHCHGQLGRVKSAHCLGMGDSKSHLGLLCKQRSCLDQTWSATAIQALPGAVDRNPIEGAFQPKHA